VVAVGEDIIVFLDVGGQLDALEYSGGVWQTALFPRVFSFASAWDYAVANDRLVLVLEHP